MTKKDAFSWRFIDDNGTFRADNPRGASRLYFPLANENGLMSAVTPDLNGDVKAGLNAFLTQPVSEYDLHNSRSRRDLWARVDGKTLWHVNAAEGPNVLEAGPLWHRMSYDHKESGLRAEVTNVVPSAGDPVELMRVRFTNTGRRPRRVELTAAVPIFGRSADNLRDHRHVTSLLHRTRRHAHGVAVTPTMTFDERGHKINTLTYAVLGTDAKGGAPAGSFPTVASFIGEGGTFDRPRAVLENRPAPKWTAVDGQETVGALRFRAAALKPGASVEFVLLLGIAPDAAALDSWVARYGGAEKFEAALTQTAAHWRERLDALRFTTGDARFNNWLRWVTVQPSLRKIFGNSFMPDFDYGRGGRGWRDLWQDCLALLLLRPSEARPMLLNNFGGVRLDGSNATIIGKGIGEFLADRNNITRTWMDHGVWPLLTTELYIHQTGDLKILLESAAYFRDPQLRRAKAKDAAWTEAYGRQWKTKNGQVYRGTVMEHILIQHLSAFFNVGEHNTIKLEDADWNDGLDMAHGRGESVAFTAQYAGNLSLIAGLLARLHEKERMASLTLPAEFLLLLDRAAGRPVNYDSAPAKQKQLAAYFDAIGTALSGETVAVPLEKLVDDLAQKAEHMTALLRRQEWLSVKGQRWFNGYYDNEGRRVEGDVDGRVRMTLTGQVFPILSGVATDEQVKEIWRAANQFLRDKELGGFRLNTDFGAMQPALGRAFSFAYGEKENGAFFNHMNVMFANSLYRRGFVEEGRAVLKSIYTMAADTNRSRVYPGLSEYFNNDGRGMYHYLTGSASWFVLTYLTQVAGVRGHWGDLLLAPQFSAEEFGAKGEVVVKTSFAGRPLTVRYLNPKKREAGRYKIVSIESAGHPVTFQLMEPGRALLSRETFPSTLDVTLG